MMIFLISLLFFLIAIRCFLQATNYKNKKPHWELGTASFIGDQEIQSDCYEVLTTKAGSLLVLADGFGKGTLGRVASHIVLEAFKTLYRPYAILSNPTYFFRRAFNLANFEVKKQLEDRKGGASVVAVFINDATLTYALAGDIKLAVFRNGELIPLSEGHTINILAEKAYGEGKLTYQKALWALKEKRLWNYVGQDGFKEIEIYDVPVALKAEDQIVLMTKGVYETLNWCQLEEILNTKEVAQEKANKMIEQVEKSATEIRENASVMIFALNQMIEGRP